MLRHLRSTAASASSHSPPPPPSPAPTEDDNEENARAIAVSDQRTIYLVNMFIANTVEFLNSFAALCNDKLALLHRKIVKLDSSLTLLEAKLHSIDDTNALGHSTSQKAKQSFAYEERYDPANLFGESSRYLRESARAILGPIQPAHYLVLHGLVVDSPFTAENEYSSTDGVEDQMVMRIILHTDGVEDQMVMRMIFRTKKMTGSENS